MNYEQKYKKAIERAKNYCDGHHTEVSPKAMSEYLFPELRESEDERIRKGLIKGLSAMRDIHKHQTFSDDAINIDDAIAWLKSLKPNHWKPSEQNIKDLEWCADLVKDKMGVGFHRLQVFIDELKNF